MAVEDLAELAQSIDYAKLLKVEQLVIDDSNEPLRAQAYAFRDTVVNGAPPVVTASDGLAAVRVAKQIVEAIKHHRWDGAQGDRAGLDIIQKD
jgi:predicted dehydrogenase